MSEYEIEESRDAALSALAMVRLTAGEPFDELPAELRQVLLAPAGAGAPATVDDVLARLQYLERVNGSLLSLLRGVLDLLPDRGAALVDAWTAAAVAT